MDPYFDVYVPRLVATLRESQLRARRKLHRGKEEAELFRKNDEEIAASLADGANIFLSYIGEKLVRREDKEKVSKTIWTIINVLENGNACNRKHCQHNNARYPYACDAGKRIHTCKEYDTYMRKKVFGAEICNRCRYAQRTNKWGAVCWYYCGGSFPEGCPRAGGGEA